MKRTHVILTLVGLVVLVSLVAATGQAMAMRAGQEAAQAPELPGWAVALLNTGVTWLITNGLKSLSKALPWVPTLEGPATALTGALVAFVVVFANGLLAMIPATYHAGVTALFTFAGTLLAAYGVQGTLKKLLPNYAR
jgi:hypothetical protein